MLIFRARWPRFRHALRSWVSPSFDLEIQSVFQNLAFPAVHLLGIPSTHKNSPDKFSHHTISYELVNDGNIRVNLTSDVKLLFSNPSSWHNESSSVFYPICKKKNKPMSVIFTLTYYTCISICFLRRHVCFTFYCTCYF